MREAIASGATIEEAQELALQELGATNDDIVQFEILDIPIKKTLGLFGGSAARVRAYIESNEPIPADSPKAGPEKKAPKEPKSEKKPDNRPKKAESAPPKRPREQDPPRPRDIIDHDRKIEESAAYIQKITGCMGFSDLEIIPQKRDDGVELQVKGEGLGVLIGHRGETLDALQYLTSLVANRHHEGDFFRVLLNTGDYRQKRAETLESVARRTAAQVRRSGRNQTLEPMNAYERRIVHTTIQDMDGIASWSVGSGDGRRVVIGFDKEASSSPRSSSGRDNHGQRDRDRNRNRSSRPEQEQAAAPASAAPAKSDSDVPLYGRIDKKSPPAGE